MLYSSLDMIRERPLTGFGLDTWPIVYPAYALVDQGVFVNHAHNDWAEWASDGGIPFAAMLFLIFAWAVRYSFRFPWGAGVVAVMLHSLVDFPMQKPCLEAFVFVILGAMAAASKDRYS
jgi:O-antigen ligase